jgi:phosphoglucomutase
MQPDYRLKYDQWLEFDPGTRKELLAISDERDIEDRFYKDLEFGTGGLRGIMGAGTNRMNPYTVSRATLGLANYLRDAFVEPCKVVIAYDSRHHSADFAADAAAVLCAAGIHTLLFDTLMPTPVLSFAVRHLHCQAGICITASHNPKAYNGYKVYDQTGCQLTTDSAKAVLVQIQAISSYSGIPRLDLDRARQTGLLEDVGATVLDAFLDAVREQSHHPDPANLKIVYTPLHGSGNIPVRTVLNRFDLELVESQMQPDGDFPTVRSPNPEDREALALAIDQARLSKADLVLGTDPDCDRLGVAVRHQGDYQTLTGNQIGALLVDFVVRNRPVDAHSALVKTIVTNDLGAAIGRRYGLVIVETLTGFKYIGEQINRFAQMGDLKFVIGYEESFGYLVGTHARDKDAVVAALLIAELAASLKADRKTLFDALAELYQHYGYYLDALDTWTYPGLDGLARIDRAMQRLRQLGQEIIPQVKTVLDYQQGLAGLPAENVLKIILEDDSWLAVRPSGTEPKLKVYYSVQDSDRNQATQRLVQIRQRMNTLVGPEAEI